MLAYPHIEAIALQIGPIKIYWYGLMYIFGFALAWMLAKLRAKKLNYNWNNDIISDFIFYAAMGVVLGGRIGYVLFYEFDSLLYDPWIIFKVWLGGMSFHGGLIGLIVSLFFFSHKVKLSFLSMLDFVSPLAPLGIALGRIGNFINAELLGRVTTMPWGMIFPNGGPLPRHPSQLYEAFVEGILLFIIVWFYSAKPKSPGKVSALFLLIYGIGRFGCEFFRQPDPQIGFVAFGWLTLGQLLSLPMIIVGAGMLIFLRNRQLSDR
jgi:phosphatidylglycerol---prolipoprotein diacylglyceryl transferase